MAYNKIMEVSPKIYAVWNNKGGVGKTTLTYLLATEYAHKNTDKNVVVLDMCPQANISEMLLGGNGKGEQNLETCYTNSKSIADYIKKKYDSARFSLIGSESNYFIKVGGYNGKMPENLYLLCGSTDLDLCGQLIEYLARAPEKKAWFHSRHILIDLINAFENSISNRENVYFVDCNPSFASYTELAIVASNRLLIPCTADAASLRGIRNILRVVYGISDEENKENVFDEFNSNCERDGYALPKIHSVIQNKSRSHTKNPSSAFMANMQQIKEDVKKYKEDNPAIFSDECEVFNIKDGNTITSVLNHCGERLSNLKAAKYEIYERETQVSQSQKNVLLNELSAVLDIL